MKWNIFKNQFLIVTLTIILINCSLFLIYLNRCPPHHSQFVHHHLKVTSTLKKGGGKERERRDPHGFFLTIKNSRSASPIYAMLCSVSLLGEFFVIKAKNMARDCRWLEVFASVAWRSSQLGQIFVHCPQTVASTCSLNLLYLNFIPKYLYKNG